MTERLAEIVDEIMNGRRATERAVRGAHAMDDARAEPCRARSPAARSLGPRRQAIVVARNFCATMFIELREDGWHRLDEPRSCVVPGRASSPPPARRTPVVRRPVERRPRRRPQHMSPALGRARGLLRESATSAPGRGQRRASTGRGPGGTTNPVILDASNIVLSWPARYAFLCAHQPAERRRTPVAAACR